MEDEKIIGLYFQRDQQAITQTQSKYGNYCYTIAWNILRNNEDSEECVNDTYMSAWNAIPPTRPASLKAFVGRITRNLALNIYERTHALKRGSGETSLSFDELSECISGEDTITDEEDYRYLVTCINSFLSVLKKEQRIIFVKRYWYENTVQEIAQNMGISESKVKVTLMRLRKKLKKYLEEKGVRV